MVDYILYGSLMSLYSGKTRSYLRKKRVPFEECLPNDHRFLTEIAPKVGGAFQPVLETPDGTIIRDSTEIIDFMEERFPAYPAYPSGPKQRVIARLFEMFGNEGLLKPAMHYRWMNPENPIEHIVPTDPNSYLARWFCRFADPRSGEPAEKIAHTRMMRIKDVILPGIGVTSDTVPLIELAFKDFLDAFNDHLQYHGYLFGGAPSVGDFGLIGPMYAHLGRDPVSSNLIKTRSPAVYDWIERMNASEAGLAMYPNANADFLPNDELPVTLKPILKLIAQDFMPEVESILSFMNAYTAAMDCVPAGTLVNPDGLTAIGTKHPIGHHTVMFRNKPVGQVVRYFTQWMFQRVLDELETLSVEETKELFIYLENTGIAPFLRLKPNRRIERRDNKEVFV